MFSETGPKLDLTIQPVAEFCPENPRLTRDEMDLFNYLNDHIGGQQDEVNAAVSNFYYQCASPHQFHTFIAIVMRLPGYKNGGPHPTKDYASVCKARRCECQ